VTYFKSLKYHSIVTFDFGCSLVDSAQRKTLMDNVKQSSPSASAIIEGYDERIYDCEFIRFNAGKEPIVLENIYVEEAGKIIEEFNESQKDAAGEIAHLGRYCSGDLCPYVVLDSYGIGTANVNFEAENIDVDLAIQVLGEFGRLVDRWLFPNHLLRLVNSYLDPVFRSRRPVLKEHHTYQLIITNDARKGKPVKRECYGLVWKDPHYNKASEEFVARIVTNIAKDSTDNLVIGNPAAFMSFEGVTFDKRFVRSHVRGIEVLRRLHHLLKKFDYHLSEVGRRGGSDIPDAIEQIVSMQDQVIKLVDYFLRPKALATEEFAFIMQEGIRVFRMSDLYENVRSKLDISYNTLNDLIQERRNKLLYCLQIIGLFFASVSFTISILHPLLLRVYSKMGPFEPIQSMLGTFWMPLGDLLCSIALTALGFLFIRAKINK
jgi:hypothetical protein